jgi:hypothetical protein
VGKAGIYRVLLDFMNAPGGSAASRTLPRFSASTGVTAQDKVDRLEARTAFLAREPDAQPEAVAPDAAVVAALDAQREAAVVGEPDAQQAAEPVAQLEAAVLDAQRAVAVVLDARQAVAAASGAQQAVEVAVVSGAQREAAVAMSGARRAAVAVAAAVKSRVRPLAASVEPAETAAVRLWSRPVLVSAPALERALVSAAKEQAVADR